VKEARRDVRRASGSSRAAIGSGAAVRARRLAGESAEQRAEHHDERLLRDAEESAGSSHRRQAAVGGDGNADHRAAADDRVAGRAQDGDLEGRVLDGFRAAWILPAVEDTPQRCSTARPS